MTCGGTPQADYCFVHAADLHLGGRRWLRSPPTHRGLAEVVQGADQLALKNLIDLCLTERASMLLCSGDVMDGWCRDHRVGLRLVHELTRLREVGCHVWLLLGNHDVRTRVMKSLLLPEHGHVLGIGGPQTRVLEQLGVALHGWSFPEPKSNVDIAASYPAPVSGLLNVGLLHTSAEGRRGHASYAPCSRKSLRHKGYDYWALGHVHAREVLAEKPWVVFCGNLQARGVRESGPKGASLVRVRRNRVLSVEHRPLDVLRFMTVVADTSLADHFDDVLAAARNALAQATRAAENRPLVVRLLLEGISGAARTLAVPPERRARAFGTLARELNSARLWLDEIWIDTGVPMGSWLVEHVA